MRGEKKKGKESSYTPENSPVPGALPLKRNTVCNKPTKLLQMLTRLKMWIFHNLLLLQGAPEKNYVSSNK